MFRYEKLLINDRSLELLRLIGADAELARAYFCFLVFVFNSFADHMRVSGRFIDDPANHKTEDFDLSLLLEHFESAIKMSNDCKLVKLMLKNAANAHAWQYLVNKLKEKL